MTTHRDNLFTLAHGLQRHVPPPTFNMKAFMSDNNGDLNIDLATLEIYHECGTSACAVGHGPLFGIPVSSDDNNWFGYCFRVFGVEDPSSAWRWLFHASWGATDNTPTGAAARILYFLDHGIPLEFHSVYQFDYDDTDYRRLIAPYLV